MTRMPIITSTSRALDWECGLTTVQYAQGRQPQIRRRPTTGLRPPSANPEFGGDRPTGDLRQAICPPWGCPRELGVSQLPTLPSPADRPWLRLLASLPSSDLVVGGATLAHPGLPSRRARSRSRDDRGKGNPSTPEAVGHVIVRALHGRARGPAAGQQRLAESCSSVSGWAVALYTIPTHPNRAIYFFLWDSTARVTRLPGYSSPPAHGWGRFHQQPRLRAATQGKDKQGCCCCCCARPGGDPLGLAAVVLCLRDAMRSKGIEAIFRAACGRGYSRTWTQRILGRYADD